MTKSLAARDLVLTLDHRAIVGPLTTQCQAGCLTALVGPNGAGKSSLMRLLAGLSQPTQGSVDLDGKALDRMTLSERARQIAFVPQDRPTLWPMPVEDLVMLGRMPHGASLERASPQDHRAVADALGRTKVPELARRCITELSGGERARVLLARALATEAPILLVDEPVAALDPHHQWVIMEVLQQEARSGAIVVAVLHDLDLAARFADQMIMLDQGAIVAKGQPETVLTSQSLSDLFGIVARIEKNETALRVVQTGLSR